MMSSYGLCQEYMEVTCQPMGEEGQKQGILGKHFALAISPIVVKFPHMDVQ